METQPKVLRWSLIIGIVIVLNLFFNYTLSLVYKHPVFEKFCPNDSRVIEPIDTQEACLSAGGQWNANATFGKVLPGSNQPDQVRGYCDPQFTCRNDFDAARRVYDRNVFITLVLLGAISVAVGNFLEVNMLVRSALSLAGVLSFIIASMRYWTSADDLVKVIILAIALAILIWVAVRKFKDR